jgi:hypothetical protein
LLLRSFFSSLWNVAKNTFENSDDHADGVGSSQVGVVEHREGRWAQERARDMERATTYSSQQEQGLSTGNYTSVAAIRAYRKQDNFFEPEVK